MTAGLLTVRHFELTAQAVAKLERGHARDRDDVQAMLDRGLVTGEGLLAFLDAIEDELYRFPAIDPPSFPSGGRGGGPRRPGLADMAPGAALGEMRIGMPIGQTSRDYGARSPLLA